MGWASGGAIIGGQNNTCVGTNAGNNITTGSQNVCIGDTATVLTVGGNNQTVIGYGTAGKGANTVTLGNDAVTDVYANQDGTATTHSQVVEGAGVSLADDATISVATNNLGGAFISVYENGAGVGGIFYASFSTGSGTIKIQGDATVVNADTDGNLCVYKSDDNHTVTIKNRLGATKSIYWSAWGARVN